MAKIARRKQLESNSGVYCIKCKVSHDMYIGSSKNMYERISRHIMSLRTGSHYNLHLQSAWNKYGEENFIVDVAIVAEPEYIKLYEKELIEIHWSKNKLYNKSRTTIGPMGIVFSSKDKADILERFNNGESADSISKSYEVCGETICKFLKLNGKELRTPPKYHSYSKEFFEKERKSGKTISEIANSIGVSSPCLIQRRMRSLGVEKQRIPPKKWTFMKTALLKYYKGTGLSIQEISKKLNVTEKKILKQWKKIKSQ